MTSYRSKVLALGSIPPSDAPKSKHQIKAEKKAMRTVSNIAKSETRRANRDAFAASTPVATAAATIATAPAPQAPAPAIVAPAASCAPEVTPAPRTQTAATAPAPARILAPAAVPTTNVARGHSITQVTPADTRVQPRRTWLSALSNAWQTTKSSVTNAASWLWTKAVTMTNSVRGYFA